MKIIYFITKSNWGGAQKYVYDLAFSMNDAGFDVSVYSGGTGRLQDELGSKAINQGKLSNSERDISMVKEFRLFSEIFQIIKSEEPDIIHVNSSKLGGLGAFAGRILGVNKIVFTAHGWPFKEDKNIFVKSLIYLFSWFTAILSHVVIVPSIDDEKKGKALPFVSKKIVYIPHGVIIENPFDPSAAKEELQKFKKIPTDKLWVGVNAELHSNKGHKYLVEAIKDLDCYLVLMSDGELRKEILNQVEALKMEDKVFLLGFVPDGAKYMKAFDVFVLPSIKEGLPYVLLEAGQLGIPTVATDVGGVSEILSRSGVLVPSKDPATLNKAIKDLLNNKDRRTSLGVSFRKHVEEKYSFEEMIKKTTEVYKAL
jgi:glycosyltransferase involved in cell wall biosynthesis